jgi:cytochrome P450
MTVRFVPTYPPRPAGPTATWRGFFGERARTSVYGWSERMFDLPYYQRTVLKHRIHVLIDPELIEHVVLTRQDSYGKPQLVRALLGPIIGQGLLTADGQLWREERKIVASSFSPAAVQRVRPIFGDASQTAMSDWKHGEVRDLAEDATRATMLIIAESLFSADPRLTSDEALHQIVAALDGVAEPRIQLILGLPRVALTAKARAGARGLAYLRQTLSALVDERLQGRAANDDFLGLMIKALAERFPPEQARALAIDNAATFYLAGHETTSNALAWTLYLLSELPDLQEQLAEEAEAVLATPDWSEQSVTAALPQLHAVLQESLRLYPPAPRFDRQAVAADVLPNGVEVGPGDIISVWPWILHRSRRLWSDPDTFDPNRFAPGSPKPGRYQYLPFGAGPRICVGAQFATVEALTILAHWLREWRFRSTGRPVQVSGLITMRPKSGLPLRIERRLR